MAALCLQSVCAAPYGSELLRDISFELAPGQVMALLGPNGAGKSSLLNLLCGAIDVTAGRYTLAGREFRDWPLAQRARSMAVLPQHSTLQFPFTVEEVILLGRSPHASGRRADLTVLEAVLEATDIATLAGRLYTQLSGGEQQRVQLARVFAQLWRAEDSPRRLLLLDEPTAALDLAHQKLVLEQVRQLAAAGVSVVLVLHDFNLAARYADSCLVLGGGRTRALGPPAAVYSEALFREVFGVEVRIGRHPLAGSPTVIQL
jgi:iron complex transport system ATP-binding protein